MDTVNKSVARIEAIIGRKVKRDIGQMTECKRQSCPRRTGPGEITKVTSFNPEAEETVFFPRPL